MAEQRTVRESGPLFEATTRQDAVRALLAKLADRLVSLVQRQMHPHHGVDTGAAKADLTAESQTWNQAHVFTTLNYWPYLDNGTRFFSGYHFFDQAITKLKEHDLDEDGHIIVERLS